MSETTVQLVYAAFNQEHSAEDALQTLKAEEKEILSGIQAAVAIRKDPKGAIHYKDVGLTPAKGALGGVILGAVIGVLTGGTGLILGALGAIVGGLVGRRKGENQIVSEHIFQVVASLPIGSSALVAVVEPTSAPGLEAELHALGAETFTAEVSADVAKQLQEHQDAAHDALMDELGKGS